MIHVQEATSLREEAAAIKDEWERGLEPDAQGVLARRPELRAEKSIVVDLAYEEYCLRFEAGAPPDADDFCDRFPTFQRSVRRLVAAHQLLQENLERLGERPFVRWPEAGDRLGDLTLLRELGRGAFARVYLASEESTGDRPVVVKLSPEGAAEARTMGRLHHPNIVPILSARFEGSVGLAAVCMPFLGAATLTDVLDRAFPTPDAKPPRQAAVIHEAARSALRADDPSPLPSAMTGKREYSLYTDAAAYLALQIAQALAFLHKEGVCHRDLKPSNVLLRPDGQALLLDFNLSADARAALPRLGGTLPYMAPEQLRALIHDDEGDALDGRVDLFALGVILYELLSGKHPFSTPPCGQPTAAAAAALLDWQERGFTSLRTLNPAVDRRLARLIESCLAFDPAGRPASAAALAVALRRYLSLPARLWRGAARRPLLPAAAAGLLLLAAGGAAGELAKQEPLEVRDYHAGQEAYRAGDFVRAEAAFSQALLDSPKDGKPRKVYMARGAAALRLGEATEDKRQAKAFFNSALLDLEEANRQQSDGATTALVGYCRSRLARHEESIASFSKAVQEGFKSADLYNDRGYGEMNLLKLPEARQDFDEALRIAPNLQAAHYNRAMLALKEREASAPAAIPESALDDMKRAVELGPEGRQLYLDAAHLYAVAAQDVLPADPGGRTAQALSYLHKAYECGQDPRTIMEDKLFKAVLGAFPDFQSLKEAPLRPQLPDKNRGLTIPAPCLPE